MTKLNIIKVACISLTLGIPLLSIAGQTSNSAVRTQLSPMASVNAQLNAIRLTLVNSNSTLKQNAQNTSSISRELTPAAGQSFQSLIKESGYPLISELYSAKSQHFDYLSNSAYAQAACLAQGNTSNCNKEVLKNNVNTIIPLLRVKGNPLSFAEAQNSASSYINSVLNVNSEMSAVINVDAFPKIASTSAMVQGVLKSISNDYQSGMMNKITQSNSESFTQQWLDQLQKLHTTDVLRLMTINQNKLQFLETLAIRQRQKSNAVSSVILAQLVKNQLSVIQQGQEIQQRQQTTNNLLRAILNQLKKNNG